MSTEADAHRAENRAIELERFREWRRTGDVAVRDSILADAQGIAIGLARRYRDRGAELDDLEQVAQIGLLLAVERFDPDRGVPFLSFAAPTVLGELRRHFRTVWSIRVPRGLQEASLRIGPVVLELQQELQRTPTVQDIASRLGCSSEAVLEAIEASQAFRAASLDVDVESDAERRTIQSVKQLCASEAEAAFTTAEAKVTVAQLLPLLSERSRRVVELRFYDELPQREIAELVGVSQMHVSRILSQAFELMAGAIAGPES